ncbi:MAG: ABC transporter permease [Chloroflexi bacterium]|nr:ABC transporter permease [Chloroflexi bacterium CFX1]MCK6567095.1 ABC transporter permease [Anaerolineales bacterium]MCQ3953377.1 ABC transporter permease [Chloroflexota bacterium]MDL1918854.1 ABC transporter permease [Chloroflexi bacterium CFX5]NUQ59421.1 ABC transporter permease [Anaerolineales bacterium]
MAESVMKKRAGWRVKLEPRLDVPPAWYPPLVSLGAIVLALFLGGLLISAVGGNPLKSYAHIARASFGNIGVLSDTIVKATPIILTALACSIAFRMKLWNIGAEGQFIMGAWGASAVVLAPIVPAGASRWVFIPVMIIAGVALGAVWGFLPGYLKAKFNVNEIISTLMLNYIAIFWVNYWVFAVWTEGGFQMSPKFPDAAWLPRLADYGKQITAFRGLTTHGGLILGIIAAVVVWFVIYRSRWGYEIRLIGDNPHAAEYAGVNITRNTVYVMALSGALAGLGGMSEVAGVIHRLQTAPIAAGYGFTGIIVAWLAKLNPIVIIFVSVLFGALILAGREIQPSGIPKMIQGIILVCLIASDYLLRYRVRIVKGEEE